MTQVYYKSIYILDIEELNDKQNDSLIMCGTQNWDHYFSQDSGLGNIEKLDNVVLYEFENNDEFDTYIAKNEFIDYSIEHVNPIVLSYA